MQEISKGPLLSFLMSIFLIFFFFFFKVELLFIESSIFNLFSLILFSFLLLIISLLILLLLNIFFVEIKTELLICFLFDFIE